MAWIDKLVSKSPIKPMQQHMSVAVLCAREILPLLDAMAAGDIEVIRDRRAEIDRLEHEADQIKHEIRSHTPKRFMMALDRRTILEILDYQDSIADITQDIAELADQRNMHLPEVMQEPTLSLARSVVAACEQGQRIIDELDELVETGFGDAEVRRVDEMILELGRLETETDRQLDTAARKLFSIEDELGVATIFLHQVLRQIATLADLAERVGNRLRLLMATYPASLFEFFVPATEVCNSQLINPVAMTAPTNCIRINPGALTGAIPLKVSVMLRAMVTAGLANEVDAVNQ